MGESLRSRTLLTGIGVFCLAWHLAGVHRWFAAPFAVWAGWDEAYITVFAQRMLDGRWLPYVDAVSHRGPVLYWLAAFVQWASGGQSWAGMRHAALLFAELNVLTAFLLGAVSRRPLAGFVAAASFVFSTAYAMEPKDGIGFNGEMVSMPFVLLGAALTTVAIRNRPPGSESRVWLAAGSGALVMIGALCKQPAGFHLAPLALWWLSTTFNERPALGRIDHRPLLGFAFGCATPALAVVAFFLQAGAWRPFSYYLFTYNRDVYMGPVTAGYAIESSFLFWRDHGALLILSLLGVSWAVARFTAKLEGWSPAKWSIAFSSTALTTVTAMQLLLALIGAFGTFRFWEHYFINALPWFGLLCGMLLEEQLASGPNATTRMRRATIAVIACFVIVSFVQRHLTTLWLDGQRRAGTFYGDPDAEPIASYVREHTPPDGSVFVWGFAPEIYTNAKRRAASRFVYTTFPSGIVPWFYWLTLDQENALAVPGSRAQLIQELEAERPPLIVDVPVSIRGRSMRRYSELAAYLAERYCYVTTVPGRNGRIADMYHRRVDGSPCPKTNPPMPKPE